MKPHAPLSFAVLVALALSACSPPQPAEDAGADTTAPAASAAEADPAYLASIEQWREERERKLREPDGWLSFAGSGEIEPGEYRVGAAPDNAIVLAGGPAHWGVLRLGADGALRFDAAPDSGLHVDGQPFRSVDLRTQLDEGGPTSVHAGGQRFYVVKTGERYGWRFRDPEAPGLRAFAGVPHFPVDPSWRIEARWEPFPEPRAIELVTSNGTVERTESPGLATFERDGRAYSLLPVSQGEDGGLFFVVADRSSGRETYGGGRFLDAEAPRDGRVVLDFNKAQNPPCALNGHVVCPLAPPENRLDLHVAAGEKTYPLEEHG